LVGKPKGYCYEDRDEKGRIILGSMYLREVCWGGWTGSIWLRIGTIREFL
jgi:hypothetical protein